MQYLTFYLDDGLYGIPVQGVQEVLELAPITFVPRMPREIRGIINIRGKVVPILDLRLRLGMSPTENNINTAIVVIHPEQDKEDHLLGYLSDAVQEVMEIPESEIQPAPNLGLKIDVSFLEGIAQKNDSFIVLLKMQKIVNYEDYAGIT